MEVNESGDYDAVAVVNDRRPCRHFNLTPRADAHDPGPFKENRPVRDLLFRRVDLSGEDDFRRNHRATAFRRPPRVRARRARDLRAMYPVWAFLRTSAIFCLPPSNRAASFRGMFFHNLRRATGSCPPDCRSLAAAVALRTPPTRRRISRPRWRSFRLVIRRLIIQWEYVRPSLIMVAVE